MARCNPYRSPLLRPFVNGVALCLLLATPAVAGATGEEPPPVTEEQLEYSKQLFAAGEKAMKAKDFATALENYKEAYRYAPHLHLFTYNIAVAAEASNDCKTAHYYYGQFLALVPEHPARKSVEKKVETLQIDCPYDQETSAIVSEESREERAEEREEEKKHRAMNEALDELLTGQRMYEQAKKRFSGQRAFMWAAWRKKRHASRMAKLLEKHKVPRNDTEVTAPQLPDDPAKACRRARSQEEQTVDALEKALELYDTREAIRVLNRFIRGAENRDWPRFDNCAG